MTKIMKTVWTKPALRKLGTIADVAGNPKITPVENGSSVGNPKS